MLGFGELFDLYCFLKFILIMMLSFLGLLVWTGNKVTNSSEVSHYSMGEELVQTSDEMDQFFEQEHEENTRVHCACSFCGILSHINTICSCCKAAFYCSEVCHVMHWRFWHKHECVEIEAAKEEGSLSRGTHCLLMEPENGDMAVYSKQSRCRVSERNTAMSCWPTQLCTGAVYRDTDCVVSSGWWFSEARS